MTKLRRLALLVALIATLSSATIVVSVRAQAETPSAEAKALG